MQVVSPIDIEDALRIDLAPLLAQCRVMATPIPPDLKADDVVLTSLGGARVSGASHEYDVGVDCYAEDEGAAVSLANEVHGVMCSLPLRDTSTQYSDVGANTPYQNNDPRAPQLARRTFRATVICPGTRIQF